MVARRIAGDDQRSPGLRVVFSIPSFLKTSAASHSIVQRSLAWLAPRASINNVECGFFMSISLNVPSIVVDVRVVVFTERVMAEGWCAPDTATRARHRAAARGNVIRNVVPPVVDFILSFPPLASTAHFAIDKPSPEPGTPAPLDGSAAVKAIEDVSLRVEGNARPGIGDFNDGGRWIVPEFQLDLAALGRVLDGVVDEVHDRLTQDEWIGAATWPTMSDYGERLTLFFREDAQFARHVFGKIGQIHRLGVRASCPASARAMVSNRSTTMVSPSTSSSMLPSAAL